MNNKVKGDAGEALAKKYLAKNGYKILQQNYRNKIGEIDLIATKKDVLVFVEVKFRTTNKFGLPREAVNYLKQNKLRKVALSYLQQNGKLNEKARFDVIDILDEQITHIKNAF